MDTTAMKTGDLKEYLSSRFGVDGSGTDMQITVFSFGFKYGIPIDADTVIDVRFLPNPFYVPEYKYSTGRVKEVADYIERAPVTREFLGKLYDFMDFMVDHFKKRGNPVHHRHRLHRRHASVCLCDGKTGQPFERKVRSCERGTPGPAPKSYRA